MAIFENEDFSRCMKGIAKVLMYINIRKIKGLSLKRDEKSYFFMLSGQTFSNIFGVVKIYLKSLSCSFCVFQANQKHLLN